MANTSFNFNIDPYYDDFEVSGGPRDENYMRILFRPGYAVQARELTQLQTIIQNQIRQFGDHVFQDGSPVQGGHLTFDNSVKSIKLQPQYQNSDIDLADFENKLIANTDTVTTTVRAQVLAADATLARPTLVFKYLSGNEFTDNQEIQVLSDATKALSNGTGALANASIVSINEGVFYVDGYFVFVPAQTIIVDAYNDKPSARIGLQIVDQIVDESADASLLDPAQSSFNYQAPGATRYQFTLELAKRTLDSVDDTKFFELIRVENGAVTKQVKYPIYSEIEKTLARRTFDESGHYTVKPFRVGVSANTSDADKFKLDIEPGKAYVNGFEFQTYGTVSVDVDKARTKNTSSDYSFSLDYGNYVVASNVYSGTVTGFANVLTGSIKTVTSLDLHAVPSWNIVTTNADSYANTKIGTAKFRNIDFAGTDTVAGDNYYVYLYDINLDTPTVNAIAGSLTTVTLPASFSGLDDAYKGVKIRINTGPAADSYTRTITAYNGTTKVATIDNPFAVVPDANTRVTFVYGVQDIDSMVITPPSTGPSAWSTTYYYTQNPATATHLCMDISVDGKTIDGKTILADTNRNKLYYELPQQYVANGTSAFSDVEYYFRHYETGVTVTSQQANPALVSGASWAFGDGTLSSLVAKSNFVVIDEDDGTIVDFDQSGNNIVISGGALEINLGYSPSSLSVISTQKFTGATSTQKSLVTPSTSLVAADSPTTATSVLGTSNGIKVNTSVGHVWFTNSNYISKTPGVAQSLYLTDVVRLVKVFDSQDIAYAPNTTNAVDVTSRYVLDSGQRDNYYDFASITLKGGYQPPKGQLVVFVEFFDQVGGQKYFSSASYPEEVYADGKIPRYSSSNETVELRDCIDFRPRRSSATSVNAFATFSLEGALVPAPEYFFETTYDYYVPRKDRLVLTKDREFKVLNGAPSIFPTLPKASDDAMVLYNIDVPAYTAKLGDVGLEYVENKRYTMRDIGGIEKRVENLEYYTSLNVLELQAKNEAILYEDNVFEKEKYGIVVDDFSNFAVADAKSKDLAINISKARLGPYRVEKPVKLNLSSSSNIRQNDKTISVSYSETSCVVQSSATKAITVQPYEFAQFHGTLKLLPESDYWYSTSIQPEVVQPGNPELPGDDPEEVLPDVGMPIEPAPEVVLPPTGFGIVEPTDNWFGINLSIGGGGTNFNTIFDQIIYSGMDKK